MVIHFCSSNATEILLQDSAATAQKKVVLKKLSKAFSFLGYLNYSDRRVDRALQGITVFEKYKGKKIAAINISVLYPYGVNLDSPDIYHPGKFQKFANSIQFKTRNWVISNELLFNVGDTLDPIAVADSERNIWKKEIYKDVKFNITELDSQSVEIEVLIRDKWNWSVLSNVGYDYLKLGLQFNNVLGFPHSIGANMGIRFRKDNLLFSELYYRYQNIKSSQISISAKGYIDNFQKSGSIYAYRPFYSSKPQWAGSFYFTFSDQRKSATNLVSDAINTNVQYIYQDFWMAKSFFPNKKILSRFPHLRLVASTRFSRTDYLKRPFLHNSSRSLNFVNNTIMLASIGFARWDYYIDRNVYYMNVQEYFTKGLNFSLVAGFQEDEENETRFYSGFVANYGKYFRKGGYWLAQFSYGGFSKTKQYNQILLDIRNNFYTPPYKTGRAYFRSFINSIVKLGFNRPYGSEIVINDNNGLKGLFAYTLRAQRSFSLSYEAVFYADFKVLGFTSAVFMFADLSLYQVKNNITDNTFQSGLGFGLRLRNLDFGIDFIEIAFLYYPKLNIPEQKQITFWGDYRNSRIPAKRDAFLPSVLSIDDNNVGNIYNVFY